MLNHLDAVVLTRVTTKAPLKSLVGFSRNMTYPGGNLVSVLMVSCTVMKGTKGGLESLLRRKVAALLDMDSDTWHHAHIAARHFSSPLVEFMSHSCLTHIWSTSGVLKPEINSCHLIVSVPERNVPHRWLSAMDVALDTLQLFDYYSLIFFSYLLKQGQELHRDVLEDIFKQYNLLEKARKSVEDIQDHLCPKFKTNTEEGKGKKTRLAGKCFTQRIELLTNLHYLHFHLTLSKEVCLVFFRSRKLMHCLHDQ